MKNITRGVCFSGLTYQEANHPVEPTCDRIKPDRAVEALDLNFALAYQKAQTKLLNPEIIQSAFGPAIGGPYGVGI